MYRGRIYAYLPSQTKTPAPQWLKTRESKDKSDDENEHDDNVVEKISASEPTPFHASANPKAVGVSCCGAIRFSFPSVVAGLFL